MKGIMPVIISSQDFQTAALKHHLMFRLRVALLQRIHRLGLPLEPIFSISGCS